MFIKLHLYTCLGADVGAGRKEVACHLEAAGGAAAPRARRELGAGSPGHGLLWDEMGERSPRAPVLVGGAGSRFQSKVFGGREEVVSGLRLQLYPPQPPSSLPWPARPSSPRAPTVTLAELCKVPCSLPTCLLVSDIPVGLRRVRSSLETSSVVPAGGQNPRLSDGPGWAAGLLGPVGHTGLELASTQEKPGLPRVWLPGRGQGPCANCCCSAPA